jgi:hypothetical protein
LAKKGLFFSCLLRGYNFSMFPMSTVSCCFLISEWL